MRRGGVQFGVLWGIALWCLLQPGVRPETGELYLAGALVGAGCRGRDWGRTGGQ